MGRVSLGVYNRIDTATLSGGSWESTLPLAKLQDRVIGKVARSTDDSLASTIVNIDLMASHNIKVLSLVNHNISLSGMVRVRGTGEASITNLSIHTEDFSNPAWVKSNTTVATNLVVAPDGATTVDGLTATSNNATIIQDLGVLSLAVRTFSVYLQRVTGTGLIQMTLDGGTTWTTKTITTTLARYEITQSVANPDCGIRIVNAGDMIHAWGSQVETTSEASSYYPSIANPGVRVAGYMDSWQSYEQDTGWNDVWPAVYSPEDLEWESPNWWSGKYLEEEITGYTTNKVILLSKNNFTRYWRIEIDDTSNPAGYVQIGRVFIGSLWEPATDAEVGVQTGWETTTTTQRALGGSRYFQRRNPFRVVTFSLKVLTLNEGFSGAFEIDRRNGLDGEVLYIADQEDTVHAIRRQFLGTLRQLTPLEQPYQGDLTSKTLTIEELL